LWRDSLRPQCYPEVPDKHGMPASKQSIIAEALTSTTAQLLEFCRRLLS
jgi:hypothetical protein